MTDSNQTSALKAVRQPTAIVIRGLPNIGKTTLANAVIKELTGRGYQPFQVNADVVRGSLNKGLGFSLDDRIENARRIGSLAFLAASNGFVPVVDFVMPTKLTFDAFADGLGITNFHLYSLKPSEEFRTRFEDTKKMFERLHFWWGGAIYLNIQELEPFEEYEVNEVAERIVQKYLFSVEPV